MNLKTMMSVIFANEAPGRSMSICQGKRLKPRTAVIDGKPAVETLTDFLPRGSTVTIQQNVAGVDSHNFPE